MIIGTGNVGSSIAFTLLNQRTPVKEVILTDINTDDAEGEVMDLTDALAVSPSFLRIKTGTYADAGDCDICVITAGANQKPGETRTDLVRKNATILKGIVDPIMNAGFHGVFLVVSNPVDTLSFLTYQYSGLPAEKVIGSGTVLDSARLRYCIAEELDVHPKSVHAYQIGEHGDSEFTLWSTATVGGEKVTDLLSAPKRQEIEKYVRNKAYQIIQKKGATYYGVSNCVTQIINCILNDEHRILPVSSYDDNTKVFNGFPAVVGKEGIIRRLKVRLTENEGISFQESTNAIKQTIAEAEQDINQEAAHA